MSAAKVIFFSSIALLVTVLGLGVAKKLKHPQRHQAGVETLQLKETARPANDSKSLPIADPGPSFNPSLASSSLISSKKPEPQQELQKELEAMKVDPLASRSTMSIASSVDEKSKDKIDRIPQLFNPFGPRLPIVQTVRYSPKVQWVKDRPAWIVDYASHYQTSKHFISRSLTGKKEYFHSEINPGDRFNVLRNDLTFEFYLMVDVLSCKMRFYYLDLAKKELVLLKTYPVVLGRKDSMSPSGCLTPLGKYKLGARIAVYKPGMSGTFRKQKTEMIQVFGTRWIPFEEEVAGCTAPARGYGIHGQPWIKAADGQWTSHSDITNFYSSDGCIRLATEDMEELFAVIVTRPTMIEIVKNFEQSTVEAKEVEPVILINP